MSQLIIVSNRLPVSVKKENGQLAFYPSVGGLATGLSSYVKDRKNIWIGWPGLPSDDLTEADKRAITTELAKHNCAPVFLTKKQLDDFYNGYSNSVLWPLCHNLRMTPNAAQERWWRAYRAVNRIFADAVIGLTQEKNTVWVHDYQLMLVPSMIRSEHSIGHIGFFMHIPFPDFRTFNKLPEAKRVLEGLLGADLIGFHTQGYVNNFFANCQRILHSEVDGNQVTFDKRIIQATDFPMGIDYAKYADAGKNQTVKDAVKKYRRMYRGMKLIVTVDRLDPSKGLVERLVAYRDFLDANPALHSKVILCMVAAPSRTDVVAYKNLKKRLDKLVIDINTTYGTPRWQPIDYIEGLPFEEVTALFRVADVALIAPLRDGMNLVAKEFIASKKKDGVLILSETAGAAQELSEALLVNPRRPDTVVAALQQALTMPKHELRQRLHSMQTHLATHTVQTWATSFMKTLNQPLPGTVTSRTLSFTPKSENQLLTAYKQATKRLILLDYDGTLTPLEWEFATAKPSSAILNLLRSLIQDDRNDIVLVSGRSRDDLDKWFGGLSLNLVAEHGAYWRTSTETAWNNADTLGVDWKQQTLPILQFYAAKTPEAMVEEKGHSLVWHYRQSPPYYAQKYSVILKRTLRPFTKKYGLEIFTGNKILEIRDPAINKGSAAKRWLTKTHDFILAAGDDYTDEDMFHSLPTSAYTIKVGPGRSLARRRISGPDQLQNLLRKCAH